MRLTPTAQKFLDYVILYGLKTAKHVTSYHRQTIWRILKSEEAKQYMNEKLEQALKAHGLTYSDLIKRRLLIAEDRKASLALKNSIYKDFQALLEDPQVDKADLLRQLPENKPLAQLLPSKEIFIKQPDDKEKETG